MELMTEQACQACNGPLEVMGALGEKIWTRCRNCHTYHIIDLNEEESCEA